MISIWWYLHFVMIKVNYLLFRISIISFLLAWLCLCVNHRHFWKGWIQLPTSIILRIHLLLALVFLVGHLLMYSMKISLNSGIRKSDLYCFVATALSWDLRDIHFQVSPWILHNIRITYILFESPTFQDLISCYLCTYTGGTHYFVISISFWLHDNSFNNMWKLT